MDTSIQSAYQEELDRLERTNERIDKQLKELQAVPRYFGLDLAEQSLDAMREETRHNLAVAVEEPYFGRLDFHESGAAEGITPLYIGKRGVHDEASGKPLVIDWRAPVASLFYSFTGGEELASYDSPDGLIDGLVYLKRNLVIRKQILQRVVDTYTRGGDNPAVTDEFLLYRLSENKDNKLRDIVSTIQTEQDKIIRAARNSALVIQGVAGSGKTTVALHRLAYLLYEYRESVRADRMIIFAPNRMFLDYISGVLPELGVGDIQQTTFQDWALERLGEDLKLADSAAELENWFSTGPERPKIDAATPGRFKGSIAFLNWIDASLDRYEAAFTPARDYEPWDRLKLSFAKIHEWFHVEYKHYPLAKRRERVLARIKRWQEMALEQIGDPRIRKERRTLAGQRLRAYTKAWTEPSAPAFYRSLLESEQPASAGSAEAGSSFVPRPVADEAMKFLKKKQAQADDLAPLVHIHNRFNGVEGNERFDHVVIDEAQDFSPFQVALLKQHAKVHSFTILGDLAQGIHAYKGILDWQEFTGLFQTEETAYFQLNRSYRSTMEIIEFANGVLAHSGIGIAPAVPVFRSGESVKLLPAGKKERLAAIIQAVRDLKSEDTGTLAVIGRTAKACAAIHKTLADEGLAVSLITAGQNEYAGGISVLPAYLAKGLEFDAVLLIDVDADQYAQRAEDAKLLYVACTRALHRLWIQHGSAPSPLLP